MKNEQNPLINFLEWLFVGAVVLASFVAIFALLLGIL